ncbi:MAG TPA: LysM peptidoglycan-binding domain-containing protein [Gammaproteobacteria bacterium]|nr:LysM peptidoglycan-binding domain-containing protein [Gammaproteobacteria bacterium]
MSSPKHVVLRLPVFAFLIAGAMLASGCAANSASEPAAGDAAAREPENEVARTAAVDDTASKLTPPGRSYGEERRQPAFRDQASFAEDAERTVRLTDRHPDRYVVRSGDTLWDISAMFLEDPWYWPEIWHINQQIENPHLIYPGDVLTLVFVDGRPQLRLERGVSAGTGTERLSPRIRAESLEDAIPTIPYEIVAAFLARPTVLDREELDALPYVLAPEDGHLMAGAGNDVYVRGTGDAAGTRFNVIHVGKPLYDPDDNDIVGFEGLYVGNGRIARAGDPSTLFLTETAREAVTGDRLMPADVEVPMNFHPRAPESGVDGQIISVVNGLALIGDDQVVVLNRGERHGLEPGHVLSVFEVGPVVRDAVAGGGYIKRRLFAEKVKLPDEPVGVVMVFKTYDRIAFALVMRATSEMHVYDRVLSPT